MDEDQGGRPSKSARKREHAAVQKLVRTLVALPPRQLALLPLEDDVRGALEIAQNLKRQAFERQVRHASGLLARTDWRAVVNALEALERPQRDEIRRFHRLEQWRDRLVAGESEVFDELVAQFKEFDRAELSRLVGTAKREQAAGRDGRAARAVFRFLATLEPPS